MRDLERLCGPWRIACIYFGSGILGNAASAIFIPHKAESGPSGSHFGLLASLFIEVINAWPLLKSPFAAIGKLSGIMIVLCAIEGKRHFAFIGWLCCSCVSTEIISLSQKLTRQRLGTKHYDKHLAWKFNPQ